MTNYFIWKKFIISLAGNKKFAISYGFFFLNFSQNNWHTNYNYNMNVRKYFKMAKSLEINFFIINIVKFFNTQFSLWHFKFKNYADISFLSLMSLFNWWTNFSKFVTVEKVLQSTIMDYFIFNYTRGGLTKFFRIDIFCKEHLIHQRTLDLPKKI